VTRTESIRIATLSLALAIFAVPAAARAGQPLETESTRLLRPGSFEIDVGFEHQRSGDGTESAVPLAIEYGVSSRLELLVEPVVYNRIHDKGARSQSGIGDIEATATSLLLRERRGGPSVAMAGEVKIPTAKNIRIGSGKADYSLYLIGGKRLGRWDTQVNVGYTFVGAPPGTAVQNVESFAVSEEFHWKERWELVGEVFGNTAALEGVEPGAAGSTESSLTPEIGGAETVGTLGVRYLDGGGLIYTLGVSYDNNAALLIHPGITLRW
jgi:outer membrane putative beta-barrel porin/alpha-amylase